MSGFYKRHGGKKIEKKNNEMIDLDLLQLEANDLLTRSRSEMKVCKVSEPTLDET